ncbi:Gfo/Idh/MocA family oxidoreductase [bacterium]|nr:Gfo/Idh/MocA family oxidoreductase [bacterium]
MKIMKVGIIGTGLQANRRLPSIEQHISCKVDAITGLVSEEAKNISKIYGARYIMNWERLVTDDKLNIIVICTPPYVHFDIAKTALEAGKHVLCEKPLTMNSADAQKLVTIANKNNVLLKCGFNHRHHPAIQKAYQLVSNGAIGKPITGRSLYGICGRQGCEQEWRSNPNYAAGGQFMEQGIHVIDLFRWFVGEFDSVSADIATHVFPIEPLEDTATALLHRRDGVTVTIHSSITQWRNRFRFELYGTQGYVEITGLGGSYDLQQLRFGKRNPDVPFSEEIIDYRGSDKSWVSEWNHFMDAILHHAPMIGTGTDGVAASHIVESAYLSAKESRRVLLEELKL